MGFTDLLKSSSSFKMDEPSKRSILNFNDSHPSVSSYVVAVDLNYLPDAHRPSRLDTVSVK